MIGTILMDFDGTLHDWDSMLIRHLDGALGLSGTELHRIYLYEIHRGIVHKNHLERHDDVFFHCKLLLQRLGRSFDPDEVEQIRRRFDEAANEARRRPIYFADAAPALERLREMGLRICLSTGIEAKEKAETFERIKKTKYFDQAFSEAYIGHLKTETDYYRIALERAESRPEEAVSIGDTLLSDIRPAKAVGIRTIWINRRCEPLPAAPEQRPDLELSGLLEAVEALTTL